MVNFNIFMAIAAFLVQNSIAQGQRSILYEGLSSGGNYIIIPQTYAPNLAANNFDDRAQSTCVTGVWLFYDYENYNGGVNAAMEFVFGRDNYCVNFQNLRQRVSSVRFAGSPTDYRADSLTLYEGTYFQGEEEYATADLPNLHSADNHRSILITGSSPWTLYDQSNYRGNTICVQSPDPNIYAPAFIYDVENIDVPHGAIRSVRKGCFGARPVKPYATPVGSDFNISGFARGGQSPDNTQPEDK